jgi:L-alanine-DL-glutamate epimerase-like enolase superfamily enzyme
LKITDVLATVLPTGSIFVRVRTDDGLTGLGECSPMNSRVVAHFVENALKPILVGQNPLEVEKRWNAMLFRTYKLGVQGVQPEAISGVDIALWDLFGQATNLPLHTIFGGCYRETVKMYRSIGGGGDMTVAHMARRVETALEEGYKAIKIRMDWGAARQDIDLAKDFAMFKECRRLCGEDIPLSFDANNGYSVSGAIRQGRKMEELGIYHFEEPVPQYDYAGMAQVADALDVPVSAGEHEYVRWQFRDLILIGKADILQPDVVKCAGLTEAKKIATLAETFNKPLVPHQTQPTVGTAANLHLIASLQHANRPQEYAGPRPELNDLFEEPLVVEDGYLRVPQKPGLGLTLKEGALERFEGG